MNDITILKIKKGMTKDEVNRLLSNWIYFEDDVFLGYNYRHNWICKCGNKCIKTWGNIKKGSCRCMMCWHNEIEKRYKYEIEKNGEYEYVRSYKTGDSIDGIKTVKQPYVKIKHKYCKTEYITQVSGFINSGYRCPSCCQKYENSFAYHIEVELGLKLEDVWDFEKNTVNPYHIWMGSHRKVWIKCNNEEINELNGLIKKDYHGSYEVGCYSFIMGRRCSYCRKLNNIHPYDSFGYYHFDKVMSCIDIEKYISPFNISTGSTKKIKLKCFECGFIWEGTPNNIHRQKQWCPNCSRSKGEKEIANLLQKNNIKYISQKEYEGLIGIKGKNLSYDFYLPEHNLLIEYQGEFHDGTTKVQALEDFERQQEHDRRKSKYAKDNNIKLLEIWYYDFDNIEEILEKEVF